jgi:hypothetical protein
VPVRLWPFAVASTTSGNAGFVTANSTNISNFVNTINLDPFTLSGRLELFAALFLEYRFKFLKVRYIPSGESDSGVVENDGAATTTPGYNSRAFCWGFVQDPAISTSGYGALVEFGGTINNVSRKSSLILRGGNINRWRYVSTTTSSPSTIDLRMVAPVQLRWYFKNNSTAAATYGDIIVDCVVQFRSPSTNATPIGISYISIEKDNDSEERKSVLKK